MKEEDFVEPMFMQKIIKSITVQTRQISKNNAQRDISIVLTYYMCNEMIQEYLTYDE